MATAHPTGDLTVAELKARLEACERELAEVRARPPRRQVLAGTDGRPLDLAVDVAAPVLACVLPASASGRRPAGPGAAQGRAAQRRGRGQQPVQPPHGAEADGHCRQLRGPPGHDMARVRSAPR